MKQALSPLLAFVSLVPLGLLTLVGDAQAQEARLGKEAPRIKEDQSFVSVVLEGFVLTPDGAPAEGAVVTSSAGGKAVADWAGRYRLETLVPIDAESVQVTAVGQGGSRASLRASTSVATQGVHGIASVDPLALVASATCQPTWQPTFGQQPGVGKAPGDAIDVAALVTFDDGSGPALYAGGDFTTAGGVAANHIARWNGSTWTALAGGPNDTVWKLAVFDDGSGPALYAAGVFTTAGGVTANGITKWNGSSWSAVRGGLSGAVYSLLSFDDGSGPALYAGGDFDAPTTPGGVRAKNIAKWNGRSWAALGSGMNSPGEFVLGLAVFDDGSGPALHAAGFFTSAGGVPAKNIAKWNGSSWAALGGGLSGGFIVGHNAGPLAVFDDGSGPALYAGGNFELAGSLSVNNIAKWNGSSWAAVGSGVNCHPPGVPAPCFAQVSALEVFDDGSGPALYVGGTFNTVGTNIAKWNGSSWVALGHGLGDRNNGWVGALTVFDDGTGPALYAGGRFENAGGFPENSIAKWNRSSWTALGKGLTDSVLAVTVLDVGGGPALIVGGSFGPPPATRIARWSGSSWASLGAGVISTVLSIAEWDDGSGPALYVGKDGATTTIERWNGTSWTFTGSFDGSVHALAVFDDGSGPALYAGGGFNTAAGVTVNHVARWNGSTWASLDSGVNNIVRCLTVFDDGSGPALYAGGGFTTAGGGAANRIAKWNGSSWAPLGSGMNSGVFSLTTFEDGSGPALYAGGNFTTAGGAAANRIAKWNGSTWAALGSGMNALVYALTAFDDGSEPAVYAGGAFTTAGGAAASRIAKWNGSSWTALGSGMSGDVRSLTAFHDDNGPALYAGGNFGQAFDTRDSYLAKWGYGPDTTPPQLELPAFVFAKDKLGSPTGEVVSFVVTASDCQDASPDLVCVPPSGSFFPRGTTLVTCTATDASGNQSSGSFPVVVASTAKRTTAKVPD